MPLSTARIDGPATGIEVALGDGMPAKGVFLAEVPRLARTPAWHRCRSTSGEMPSPAIGPRITAAEATTGASRTAARSLIAMPGINTAGLAAASEQPRGKNNPMLALAVRRG